MSHKKGMRRIKERADKSVKNDRKLKKIEQRIAEHQIPDDPNWAKTRGMRPLRSLVNKISRTPQFIKAVNDYRIMWKKYKKNIPEHNKYSCDPLMEALFPHFLEVINEEKQMIYEKHVRKVVEDVGGFLIYVLSEDTAYRPIRNYILHKIVHDKRDEIVKALAKEREIEDYLNPDDWFDNMKVKAVKITDKKRASGEIPKESVSGEHASFIDELHYKQFENKMRNKEL